MNSINLVPGELYRVCGSVPLVFGKKVIDFNMNDLFLFIGTETDGNKFLWWFLTNKGTGYEGYSSHIDFLLERVDSQ